MPQKNVRPPSLELRITSSEPEGLPLPVGNLQLNTSPVKINKLQRSTLNPFEEPVSFVGEKHAKGEKRYRLISYAGFVANGGVHGRQHSEGPLPDLWGLRIGKFYHSSLWRKYRSIRFPPSTAPVLCANDLFFFSQEPFTWPQRFSIWLLQFGKKPQLSLLEQQTAACKLLCCA